MVNYHSAELVRSSLASLDIELVDEILIWDNASGVHELAELAKMASVDRRIRIYGSDVNVGFGAGHNALADRSVDRPEDIVWILNPDTKLVHGTLAALRQEFMLGEFDVLSPLLVCGDLEKPEIWYNGGGIDVSAGRCWHEGYGETGLPEPGVVKTTEFMTGAAPMMTRETWDLLGGFHERLFLYWEDVELSLRAADLGLALGVSNACVVWHMEGGSGDARSGHSATYHYYNALNRLRVCAPRSGRLSVAFGPGLRETLAGICRPLVKERDERLRKTFAAIRGTLRGIASSGRGLGPRRLDALGTLTNTYRRMSVPSSNSAQQSGGKS